MPRFVTTKVVHSSKESDMKLRSVPIVLFGLMASIVGGVRIFPIELSKDFHLTVNFGSPGQTVNPQPKRQEDKKSEINPNPDLDWVACMQASGVECSIRTKGKISSYKSSYNPRHYCDRDHWSDWGTPGSEAAERKAELQLENAHKRCDPIISAQIEFDLTKRTGR